MGPTMFLWVIKLWSFEFYMQAGIRGTDRRLKRTRQNRALKTGDMRD